MMRHALLACWMVGCAAEGAHEKGQSGTDVSMLPCGELAGERTLAADEAVRGVTPNQLVALSEGNYSFRESWTSFPASTGKLTRDVVRGELQIEASPASAVERRWRTPGRDDSCSPTLHIPSVITLRTEDGMLAGDFPGWLHSRVANGGEPAFFVDGTTSRDQLTGSYDASGYAQHMNITVALMGQRQDGTRSKLTQSEILANDSDAAPGTKGTLSIALWFAD